MGVLWLPKLVFSLNYLWIMADCWLESLFHPKMHDYTQFTKFWPLYWLFPNKGVLMAVLWQLKVAFFIQITLGIMSDGWFASHFWTKNALHGPTQPPSILASIATVSRKRGVPWWAKWPSNSPIFSEQFMIFVHKIKNLTKFSRKLKMWYILGGKYRILCIFQAFQFITTSSPNSQLWKIILPINKKLS